MFDTKAGLIDDIRNCFAQVDTCPVQGPRIFFENAGGALTLKSVVETSTQYAAIPDNQGRANVGAEELVRVINQSRQDMRTFFNAPTGQVFVGESGTELTFRLISVMCLGVDKGGNVLGSTFEHPASRSAATRWASIAGLDYVDVGHDVETGLVTPAHYAAKVTLETCVATILHTSPVTGMGADVVGIVKAIRAVSPECFIFVDGIQHAAHGHIDIASYDIDAYVISPYKCFSRHGYGVAWASDRLTELPRDGLIDGPARNWELGTRDTGAYATFSDVVTYLKWLGSNFTESEDAREQINAAGKAIHAHEQNLTNVALKGIGNLKGLTEMEGVEIVGGANNPAREGLVSFWVKHVDSAEVVDKLNAAGIRTHVRKADHYSGTVLKPMGLETCIRTSFCHYNTEQEVAQFLAAMQEIVG